MSCKILVVPEFSVKLKKLAKKHKRIKDDLKNLTTQLGNDPKSGIALQNNCYKIRVANSSIPTGKSGGFRVIYYFLNENNHIYLLSIYSKTQAASISESELLSILNSNNLN